ncbi:stimulated by retinoic acid gene 6 protein-like [Lepisosteus oculatus]|uniref:stimulated by retinoic acid gene 6 protein-like n=1 Tax=Lepisosteus oculatus TaxID=7918 RepID=UPI0035F508F1
MEPSDSPAILDLTELCADFRSLHYWLIPAVLITLILSFLKRRQRHHRVDELVPLDRRFGMLVPIRLLSTHSNRWTFAAAFGAIANVVLERMLRSGEYSCLPFLVPAWAKVIVQFLLALEVALVHYPIFICLTTDHKIVGSLLGFFYTLSWFVYQVKRTVDTNMAIIVRDVYPRATPIPAMLCTMFLILRFLVNFIQLMDRRWSLFQCKEDQELFVSVHHIKYVKRLLKPSSPQVAKSWFQRNIYDWDPFFRFPARMIIMVVLGLNVIYTFVFINLQIIFRFPLIKDLLLLKGQTHSIFATVMAGLVSIAHIFHILAHYRTQMKRLFKGDRTGLPHSVPPSDTAMAKSITYMGVQIAFLFVGQNVLSYILFIAAIIFDIHIVQPLKDGGVEEIVILCGNIVTNVVPFLVVYFAQRVIVRVFFLQDRLTPADRHKPLALKNLRAFENVCYFSLFYNAIVGLLMAMKRLLISLLLGSFTVSRIDQTLMPSGVHGLLDSGYWSWVSVLLVDSSHTNPTALSFCHCLLEDRQLYPLREDSAHWSSTDRLRKAAELCESRRESRGCRRWWLCYTLLRNPSLVVHRRRGPAPNSSSGYC